MGLRSSLPLTDEELSDVKNETGFSNKLIYSLNRRFNSLDRRGTGYLSRDDFLTISKLAMNPLRDRIIQSFFVDGSDGVNFCQFLRVMARFRPVKENVVKPEELNSRQSKLSYSFKMIDTGRDGKISKNELVQLLRLMVRIDVTEEQLNDVADRAISDADTDGDGMINFDEFVVLTEKMPVEEKLSLRFLIA